MRGFVKHFGSHEGDEKVLYKYSLLTIHQQQQTVRAYIYFK